MEKSYTSIVCDAKPVNTTKRKPDIEEGPLKKQEEGQNKPNLAKSDNNATGTSLAQQTGKNMERRRKALYQDDEKADRIPEREVYVMMNKKQRLIQEGKVHIVILNQARKPLIKKGPYPKDESSKKTA